MATPYFPGCTLATSAAGFDVSGRAVAAALGLPLVELDDWQCCGATFPLATDNALALLAPTRILIQAQAQGDRLATLCAVCYNVLKRTSVTLRRQPELLGRINWFVGAGTPEALPGATAVPPLAGGSGDGVPGAVPEYRGQVRVLHFLEMLRDELGWDELRRQVTAANVGRSGSGDQPASAGRVHGLRVAPYYGCLLLRPHSEIGLDDSDAPTILADCLRAAGVEPVDFPFATECCGSYLAISKPDLPATLSGRIVEQAAQAGAQAIVTACPLCQYNLDRAAARERSGARLPVLYFTQLLAAALDLPPADWGLDGHAVDPAPLFAGREEVAAP
jgi:heterodisulfide reductase subunit B2